MRKNDKIAASGMILLTLLIILLSFFSLADLAMAMLAVLILASYGVLWKKLDTNRKIIEKHRVLESEPSSVSEDLLSQIQANDTKKILSAIAAMRISSDRAVERLDQFQGSLVKQDDDEIS